MKVLKVLVGCEENQEVCKAFRALGHEAYSCDLLDCSGGHPEWHLKIDVFDALELKKWDLFIGRPPSPKLSRCAARWLYPNKKINVERLVLGFEAKIFFMNLLFCNIKHVCIENPTPLKIFELPKESQIIQPCQFGHPFSKRTLLWLKNLPPLNATDLILNYKPYLPSNTGGKKRCQKATPKTITSKNSSKTFPGIAAAMASQWSEFLTK